MGFIPDHKVLNRFVKWLEGVNFKAAAKWATLYKNNPEAAMCEATFWGVLIDCGVNVLPNVNDDGHGEGPDFVCCAGGQKFYVEVTCMTVEVVTNDTTLEDFPTKDASAQSYGLVNNLVFNEVRKKTPQCSNLDAPCLLAIGTFHFQASCLCFDKLFLRQLLTGKELLTFAIDDTTGGAIEEPHSVTRLGDAVFVRPGKQSRLDHARTPVSGILLGGFGCKDPPVLGLLHPKPLRPFDRVLLPRIEFCRLLPSYIDERFGVEWLPGTP